MARIDIVSSGIRDLLRSPEMAADLEERAHRVKAAAESRGVLVLWPSQGRIPMPYTVEIHRGRTRVHATVAADHPAGLAAEAKYHTLTSSLDAAR